MQGSFRGAAAVLLVLSLVGCGTASTPTSATASSHHAPATSHHSPQHSSNPFHSLTTVELLMFQHDLHALQVATGTAIGAESTWWTDGAITPQTATLQAQEQQAAATMQTASTAIPGIARSVIGDVQFLPAKEQPPFAALVQAARDLLAAQAHFVVDSTTPWAGQGSTPGVTKAVVGQRLQADVRAMVKALAVAEHYQAQLAAAESAKASTGTP